MNRKRLLMGIMLLGITFTGCGTDETVTEYEETVTISQSSETKKDDVTEPTEQKKAEDIEKGVEDTEENILNDVESPTEEKILEQETPENEDTELTFEELSKRQFGFSSGAGGWGEEFTIEKDGFFTGKYHDSDMGDIGEGYEYGTRYCSSYSGHFTELQKVDEYTYKMTLSDITYKEEEGTQELQGGIRYVYTDSYCLGDNDTFFVYLPGTPISRFSEEEKIWLYSYNESETELTMTVIVDEKNGYGMYSYERLAPLEDARMTYETYKESYDYYAKMASEGNSTMEIKEYASAMYEVSDECLNYIWNLIRYNVEEEAFEIILAEQRQWIRDKEEKADAAKAEWGMGTFAPIIYLDTKAEMTIQRCEELIQYLQ